MTTDRVLARMFGIAICGYGAVLILALVWQILHGYETDKNAHDLTYLIVGIVGGQATTHASKEPRDGTQDVSVPDPLPAPAASTTPPVPPSNPADAGPAPVDAMPDPDGSDPGLATTSDAGHADLALLAVVTAGVFLGGLILHLVLT